MSSDSPDLTVDASVLAPSPNQAHISAKDRFMTNQDVMDHVFRLFIPNSSDEQGPENGLSVGGQKQLLRIAVSCKAFRDPALACLWSHLDSLKPLFDLHPGLQMLEGYSFFRGEIDSRGSLKFHEYARRVRSVHFKDGTENTRMAPAGWAWLGHQLRGIPLLPGLLDIKIGETKFESVHLGLLPFLTSSSVETVEFSGSYLFTPLFHAYTLPLLCDATSSIKHLTLRDASPRSEAEIWGALLGVHAPALQSLSVRFPNNQTLRPKLLGQLGMKFHHLTSLILDVHTPSHGPSEEIVGQTPFPALTSLHLISRSGAALCRCFPQFLIHKTTSITFHVEGNILPNNAFSNALTTLSTMNSLSKVEITTITNNVIVSAAAISPLLQQLDLEHFFLHSWGFQQLSLNEPGHQQIHSIIDAIPAGARLRALAIPLQRHPAAHNPNQYYYSPYTIAYPPVSCLCYVAQHAKGLRKISLSIDSSVPGPNGETLKSMIDTWQEPDTPSGLLYLEIADMRQSNKLFAPSEYSDLARLLDTIFPSLLSVTMVKDPQVVRQWEDNWRVIEEFRQMNKSLRLYRSNRW